MAYYGGADACQKGEAAELRNTLPNISAEDRTTLNQIVHSGDVYGRFADTPNPYRDLGNQYDPYAQEALDSIKSKYGK